MTELVKKNDFIIAYGHYEEAAHKMTINTVPVIDIGYTKIVLCKQPMIKRYGFNVTVGYTSNLETAHKHMDFYMNRFKNHSFDGFQCITYADDIVTWTVTKENGGDLYVFSVYNYNKAKDTANINRLNLNTSSKSIDKLVYSSHFENIATIAPRHRNIDDDRSFEEYVID